MELRTIETANYFSASVLEGTHLSVAELDRIFNFSGIEEQTKKVIADDEIWFWFCRLKVHEQERGKGISKQLLSAVCNWADKNTINIFLGINPYGPLNLADLILLYSKFGFIDFGNGMMARYSICIKNS